MQLLDAERSDTRWVSHEFHCYESISVTRRVCSTPNKMLEKLNGHTMDLIESMDSSTIRVDKDTKAGSVMDTIRMILRCDSSKANTALSRLFVNSQELGSGVASPSGVGSRCTYLKINGKGKITPVADAKTLIEIVWLLPA